MINGYEIFTSCGSISSIEVSLEVPDVKHLIVLLEVVLKYLEMGSTNSKVFGSTRVVVKYWKKLVVKYLPAAPVVTYFLPIRHRTLSRRDRQTRLLFLLFISSSPHSQFFSLLSNQLCSYLKHFLSLIQSSLLYTFV